MTNGYPYGQAVLEPVDDRRPGLFRVWAHLWIALFVGWTAFAAAVAVVYLALRAIVG